MLDIEKRLSGFNEEAFIRAFKASGGTWIQISPAQFEFFDGSHLSKKEAERFTEFLAESMQIDGIL